MLDVFALPLALGDAAPAGTLGLALGALLLDRSSALGLLFGLLALLLCLLLGKLFSFLGVDFAGTLFDLGREALADFLNVGIGKHACMAFRRYLHLMQPVEQFLARHVKLFRQFMYSHAGHVPLLLFSSDATARVARHLAGNAL